MKPHTIHHDQTRNPGEVFPDSGPWRPIQRQAAEALWNELETMKSSVGELPKEAENLWIVSDILTFFHKYRDGLRSTNDRMNISATHDYTFQP